MLQSGGGNNTTSALLKEYFASEKACQLNSLNGSLKAKPASIAGCGILPCPTAFTDMNSLKKAASSKKAPSPRNSPRNAGQSPRNPPRAPVVKPLDGELSMGTNNSGSQEVSPLHAKAPSPRNEAGALRVAAHGRTGPFGRRNVEKEFYDSISSGHIPCLSLPSL